MFHSNFNPHTPESSTLASQLALIQRVWRSWNQVPAGTFLAQKQSQEMYFLLHLISTCVHLHHLIQMRCANNTRV